MIKYNTGGLGLCFILRINGSVFPKALLMAVPNAIVVFLIHRYARYGTDPEHVLAMDGVEVMWAGYTSVLSFLIVFRNNQAYTRFWEGATLIHQVRGEWLNAVSGLIAFCNDAEHMMEKVEVFQHTLVRLVSLLHCSALQQVCELSNDSLEVIGFQGINPDSLEFMEDSHDRCEVIMQWLQRLVVEANRTETIDIAPPVLSRCFQEFSRGIVHLNNVRKIKEIPFPFPYAQLITSMLLVHWVATPVIAAQLIKSNLAATAVCFSVTFVLWCLVFIVLEIDQPFGEDANDLPIREMQKEFNRSLLTLMHRLAQTVPVCTRDLRRASRANSRMPSAVPSDHSVDEPTGESTHVHYAQEVEDMIEACTVTTPSMRQHSEKRGADRSKEFGSETSGHHWYSVLLRKPSVLGQGRDSRSEDSRGHTSERKSGRQSEVSNGHTSGRSISRQSQESVTAAPRSAATESGGGGRGASHGQLEPAVLRRTEFHGRSYEQEGIDEAPRSDAEDVPCKEGSIDGEWKRKSYGRRSGVVVAMSPRQEKDVEEEAFAARGAAPRGETLPAFGHEADTLPEQPHLQQLGSDQQPIMQSF